MGNIVLLLIHSYKRFMNTKDNIMPTELINKGFLIYIGIIFSRDLINIKKALEKNVRYLNYIKIFKDNKRLKKY